MDGTAVVLLLLLDRLLVLLLCLLSMVTQPVGDQWSSLCVVMQRTKKDTHLGASRSRVSLGSIQTTESLQRMTRKGR